MEKLSNFNVIELDEHRIKNIDGGSILEGLAWLYGLAHGAHERRAGNRDWNDINWEKKRTLVGG
jgi:hypothetical protein